MKKVCRKLAKKYYTPLKKVNANKVFTAQMTDKLKAYDLMREINDDLVYYQLEILYRGICNKECLEEMFLDAYVKMYDYWQDLDYQQRKHQVNVDLQPYLEQMCCFVYEGEVIYLPMFDRRMNQLYREDGVVRLKAVPALQTCLSALSASGSVWACALCK